eukprot:Polyplicarium_translucidae@DN2214_c0_g1_i2.p1
MTLLEVADVNWIWGRGVALYFFMFISRVAVFALFLGSLMRRYSYTVKELVLLTWGGLRGAVVLALALQIAADPYLRPELVVTLTVMPALVVTAMLIVNGMTFEFLYKWLQPHPPEPFRRFFFREAVAQLDKVHRGKLVGYVRDSWLFCHVPRKERGEMPAAFCDIVAAASATVPIFEGLMMSASGRIDCSRPNAFLVYKGIRQGYFDRPIRHARAPGRGTFHGAIHRSVASPPLGSIKASRQSSTDLRIFRVAMDLHKAESLQPYETPHGTSTVGASVHGISILACGPVEVAGGDQCDDIPEMPPRECMRWYRAEGSSQDVTERELLLQRKGYACTMAFAKLRKTYDQLHAIEVISSRTHAVLLRANDTAADFVDSFWGKRFKAVRVLHDPVAGVTHVRIKGRSSAIEQMAAGGPEDATFAVYWMALQSQLHVERFSLLRWARDSKLRSLMMTFPFDDMFFRHCVDDVEGLSVFVSALEELLASRCEVTELLTAGLISAIRRQVAVARAYLTAVLQPAYGLTFELSRAMLASIFLLRGKQSIVAEHSGLAAEDTHCLSERLEQQATDVLKWRGASIGFAIWRIWHHGPLTMKERECLETRTVFTPSDAQAIDEEEDSDGYGRV